MKITQIAAHASCDGRAVELRAELEQGDDVNRCAAALLEQAESLACDGQGGRPEATK